MPCKIPRASRKVSKPSIPGLPARLEKLRKAHRRGLPVPGPLKTFGLDLVRAGFSASEVAPVIGVTPECIRLWKRSAPGVDSTPADAEDLREPGPRQETLSPVAQAPAVEASPAPGPAPTSAPTKIPRDDAQGIAVHEEAAILDLKKRHPNMGPAQIRVQLKRFKGWRLPVRRIARTLRNHGYEVVHVGSRPKDEVLHRFEAPHRCALWQLDFVELRVGPERVSLLLVLDDFSRYITGWALLTEVTSEAVVAVMKEAIRRHGKPESIYTDRGSPFLAWRESTSLSRFLEAELIDHHVGTAYRPQGRGKVEALAATVQRELWNVIHFESVDAARKHLADFVRWYNESRAHMGIDGLTPADRFFGRWEQVKAQVDAVSRNRQGSQSFALSPRILEEIGGPEGPVEVLRLMVVEGRAEIRFLGHRIELGPVTA